MANHFAVLQIIALCLQAVHSLTQCNKTSLFLKSYLPHPEDCSLYYVCFHGRRFLKKCDDAHVFEPSSESCVPKGSLSDSCSSAVKTVSPVCSSSEDLYPHAESCAKYFDCSRTSRGGVPRSRECSYPYLFDSASGSCQYFTEVNCGSRPEPKHPCDYDVYTCAGPDCAPCRSRFASCLHQPDGLNPWRGKEWTSHYVVCLRERAIFHGACTSGWVFHPVDLKCIDANKIQSTR
ncbi:uncharacterized protein LOC144627663 [Crassostrea virginica]